MVDGESETLRGTQSPQAIETARDKTPPTNRARVVYFNRSSLPLRFTMFL